MRKAKNAQVAITIAAMYGQMLFIIGLHWAVIGIAENTHTDGIVQVGQAPPRFTSKNPPTPWTKAVDSTSDLKPLITSDAVVSLGV